MASSLSTALAALVLFMTMTPGLSFLDRKRGLHLFALPETRSALHHAAVALHGNSRWRLLQQRNGGYPEVHDAHEFVGSTELGFIAFNVRGMHFLLEHLRAAPSLPLLRAQLCTSLSPRPPLRFLPL